ncbi:hypothetical protein BJV74DRAFT_865134 [Russula compacta]|nr:hypothetical protein BJV74DRAFT_865134 [Russula compacta]
MKKFSAFPQSSPTFHGHPHRARPRTWPPPLLSHQARTYDDTRTATPAHGPRWCARTGWDVLLSTRRVVVRRE